MNLHEGLRAAEDLAHAIDGIGIVGYGVAHLLDENGRTKLVVPFANLITTAGDEYYARMGIVGVLPANAIAPTVADGMKLGTSATAPSKSGAGAALGAYIGASNKPFDASYPQVGAVSGDGGWNVTYKTTWAPGEATNSAIAEVVLVNDRATDAASGISATYARALITPVLDKQAGDTLTITWNHKFLGA